jgi:hypothetical protein
MNGIANISGVSPVLPLQFGSVLNGLDTLAVEGKIEPGILAGLLIKFAILVFVNRAMVSLTGYVGLPRVS